VKSPSARRFNRTSISAEIVSRSVSLVDPEMRDAILLVRNAEMPRRKITPH